MQGGMLWPLTVTNLLAPMSAIAAERDLHDGTSKTRLLHAQHPAKECKHRISSKEAF